MSREVAVLHRVQVSGITYPRTETQAKRQHLPWKPALVGRTWRDTPQDIERFYREVFGHSATYSIYIGSDGTRYQAHPLSMVTAHAGWRWNPIAYGVAWIGDGRVAPPSGAAYLQIVDTLAALNQMHHWSATYRHPRFDVPVPRIVGHDELPQATATPGKQCPGRYVPMADIRAAVAKQQRWAAYRGSWSSLAAYAGFVW